jgi:DNA-binding transcriptional ArsR family regulator
VPYAIIGAWALSLWGKPRATADLDFLVLVKEAGLRRLTTIMAEAGSKQRYGERGLSNFGNTRSWEVAEVRESRYRESRMCRALGNPVVYSIVRLLHERGAMSPTKIADVVGRRLQTVSGHLATLRAVDLVRYERRNGVTRYWLKHESETARLLAALASLVRQSTRMGD